MTEKQYRQIAFIILSLFVVGIVLIGLGIELGVYLSITMFLNFIILAFALDINWILGRGDLNGSRYVLGR